MSEQQMPARIWVNPIAIVSPDIYFPNAVMVDGNENIKTGDVSFVRADIADRMAVALTLSLSALHEAEAILGGEYGDHYGPLCEKMLSLEDAARSALSAFKDSAQDRGAS